MIELAPDNRLPHANGTVLDIATTHRDGDPMRNPVVPTVSSKVVPAEKDGTDLLCNAVVSLVRHRLGIHPHFRGRASLFTIERIGKTITITGRVPTYYLKQLLQEAIKAVPGVVNIDNRVHVTWSNS